MLCDFQTSSGLLLAVSPERKGETPAALPELNGPVTPITGELVRTTPGGYSSLSDNNKQSYRFLKKENNPMSTRQNTLIIINDGPYGNERAYNALRLALNLVKRPELMVRVFLTGDGVACAKRGQKTPTGFYNIERMLKSLARRGEVAV